MHLSPNMEGGWPNIAMMQGASLNQYDALYGIAQRPIEYGGGLAAYCNYVRCKAQSSGEMYVGYHGRPQSTYTNIMRG